jgi:isochorismate pyruvate lyase
MYSPSRPRKRTPRDGEVEKWRASLHTIVGTIERPAMTATKLPSDCETKDDVRAEIDRIDHALIELFAERHGYVTRMAEIKTDPHEANDPARIEAIVAKRRAQALELDLDEDQIELLWRTLIDWNINYEKGIIIARTRKK